MDIQEWIETEERIFDLLEELSAVGILRNCVATDRLY